MLTPPSQLDNTYDNDNLKHLYMKQVRVCVCFGVCVGGGGSSESGNLPPPLLLDGFRILPKPIFVGLMGTHRSLEGLYFIILVFILINKFNIIAIKFVAHRNTW